ncbi:hypothetical protein [Marinobacterium rhizophilum]|uniref:Uncharacterized protein n=1 Tax=Marinobacterium rhizophilum TaxID=420402 RepID=A0ABY5HPF5_9GAMM|nr:hypothetical protein [Marinobacterium rhizophilum]UTW13428.1 hypothetical protein KDW95_07200 [Marinobacterium rhizophilum]
MNNLTDRLPVLAGMSALLLTSLLATTVGAGKQNQLSFPDWPAYFNGDGTLKDAVALLGTPDAADHGQGAMFVEDNISDGRALDMSALIASDSYDQSIIHNATVDALHDIGNLYVYGEMGPGGMVFYSGVERLDVPGNSYVEFEFNQGSISAPAVNAPLMGERLAGDLLVRINLSDAEIGSVEFLRWHVTIDSAGSEVGHYQPVASAPAPRGKWCSSNSSAYRYCSGAPVEGLAPTNTDVWDADGQAVAATPADSFIELALNPEALPGQVADFTSLVVRTPEDIAIAYLRGRYRDIAYWR